MQLKTKVFVTLLLFLSFNLKSQSTLPHIELVNFECGNLKFQETQAYDGAFEKKYWMSITGIGKELTKWDKLEDILHFTTFNGSGEFWTQYETAGEVVAISNKIPVAQYCGFESCEDIPTLVDSLRKISILLLKAQQEIDQLETDLYSGTIFNADCAASNQEKDQIIDSLALTLSKADSVAKHYADLYNNQPLPIETIIKEVIRDTCLAWENESKDQAVSVELYPNPVATDEIFTLAINGPNDYHINFYNEIGSQVGFNYEGVNLSNIHLTEGIHQFSLSGVGFYLMTIETDEMIVTKKVIVINKQ